MQRRQRPTTANHLDFPLELALGQPAAYPYVQTRQYQASSVVQTDESGQGYSLAVFFAALRGCAAHLSEAAPPATDLHLRL